VASELPSHFFRLSAATLPPVQLDCSFPPFLAHLPPTLRAHAFPTAYRVPLALEQPSVPQRLCVEDPNDSSTPFFCAFSAYFLPPFFLVVTHTRWYCAPNPPNLLFLLMFGLRFRVFLGLQKDSRWANPRPRRFLFFGDDSASRPSSPSACCLTARRLETHFGLAFVESWKKDRPGPLFLVFPLAGARSLTFFDPGFR